MTERAQVLGKRRVTLGAAYQYFDFHSIDGISMKQMPNVLGHSKFDVPKGAAISQENDYITNLNNLSLHLNQISLYVVYGISNRVDVSAELPIETIHFSAFSQDHIVRTVTCENTLDPATNGGSCNDAFSDLGEYHFFGNPSTPAEAYNNVDWTFANGGNASGIGDLILRAKGEVINGEKDVASAGVAVRLPSGDADNLLGSGTIGVQPFGAYTYRARVSPHALIGYQWNGQSILPGNPFGPLSGSTTTLGPVKRTLPPSLVYSGGVDVRLFDRLTVAADLIGQRYFSSHIPLTSDGQTQPSYNAGTFSIGTYTSTANNQSSSSPELVYHGGGLQYRQHRRRREDTSRARILLTGNITTRVDNGGLVARVVPLVGLSYAF